MKVWTHRLRAQRHLVRKGHHRIQLVGQPFREVGYLSVYFLIVAVMNESLATVVPGCRS